VSRFRFSKHSPPYVVGDVAEFDPDTAARHERAGDGELVEQQADGTWKSPRELREEAARTSAENTEPAHEPAEEEP